jgi:hypothetical protein
VTLIQKPPDQLIKEDLIRQTLVAAAKAIEVQKGNPTYRQAWKRAIHAVMSLKPESII